jgi:hypothetical protein
MYWELATIYITAQFEDKDENVPRKLQLLTFPVEYRCCAIITVASGVYMNTGE